MADGYEVFDTGHNRLVFQHQRLNAQQVEQVMAGLRALHLSGAEETRTVLFKAAADASHWLRNCMTWSSARCWPTLHGRSAVVYCALTSWVEQSPLRAAWTRRTLSRPPSSCVRIGHRRRNFHPLTPPNARHRAGAAQCPNPCRPHPTRNSGICLGPPGQSPFMKLLVTRTMQSDNDGPC